MLYNMIKIPQIKRVIVNLKNISVVGKRELKYTFYH